MQTPLQHLSHLILTIWSYASPLVEIGILWFVFYRMLIFFEGTRAFQVLRGIIYLLIIFLLSLVLDLHTLTWILTKIFGISIIAVLIIFHPEFRQGLARLGQKHLFSTTLGESEILAIIEQITSAVLRLANKKIGCLIAIERENRLHTYIESGVVIDSKVSEELIQSIFVPQSPLHDGGVIIQGERVVAASCLFPLSENPHFSKITGTRHRAALGLSEQTDAIVIMVSEQNADIALAADGKFMHVAGQERLTELLKHYLIIQDKKK